ncbi:RNA polymerase sigma factor [Lewinella sp. 4G2]|uniref:RNA polymerase sigma factor n=1 Tax=Lewinella sp. 4G2 TaxID=1803372 RepID=UPI0007B498E9|nr:sigma-70 family RNA polymerase sigma factor [Lewinella sp. 4G2]OAV43435.1 hypothetical protein A3850_002510 [Lewinella sp. 4G2]
MTDAEIHTGIINHDPATLGYLYEHWFPPIDRQTQALGGTAEDSFDVFQESIVVLYLNASTGKVQPRADSRLSTYLQAVAKNIWRAQTRKNRKLATVDLPPQIEQYPEELDDELYTRVTELEAALANLGEKCRRLLHLFYFEKLSLRRIAEVMTYTEQTAKNNKYRCVQRLRAQLKPS